MSQPCCSSCMNGTSTSYDLVPVVPECRKSALSISQPPPRRWLGHSDLLGRRRQVPPVTIAPGDSAEPRAPPKRGPPAHIGLKKARRTKSPTQTWATGPCWAQEGTPRY